ncbi:uncharacterized protein [Typha latifolia]|uniref:uncharacterized protein n=1 Tax=Typha latifolia TaxID=4733 RepID=UPI003C2F5CB8
MARGFRGVRDDLSELGRHLVDVACFLHPLLSPSYVDSPPSTPRRSPSPRPPSSRMIAGILGDLAEVSGALRGGLSRLSVAIRGSPERGVGAPDDRARVVGISDDVLEFVRDLVKSPESWVDFAVPVGEDDFNMSHLQRDHVAAVERLSPELAELRVRLCPAYMNEHSFWKIYFVLLHPKLNEHDSELLLSQQIVDSMHVVTEMQQHHNSETESLPIMHNRESQIVQEDGQSLGSQTFVKVRSDQSIGKQVFTKTRSEQSIDQWSEIPSDVDALSDGKRQLRTEDLLSSNIDGGNAVVLEKYMDSLLVDENKLQSLSPSIKWDNIRRKPSHFGDYSSHAQQASHVRVISSDESSDWHAIGDAENDII